MNEERTLNIKVQNTRRKKSLFYVLGTTIVNFAAKDASRETVDVETHYTKITTDLTK